MKNRYQQYTEEELRERNILIILIGFFLIVIMISLTAYTLRKRTKMHEIHDGSRTVMIYMVGADLELDLKLATIDLEGIDYDDVSDNNTNVYVITGGTKEWQNDFIDSDKTTIFKLTEDGYTEVKEYPQQNMGNYEVLRNFLNFVYKDSNTEKYDLIFWNHGGAVHGSEYDEYTKDNLSLNEMELALSESKFNKNNKLETVVFRTCLNGTLEVANTFKDYADYMVGSEEITIGSSVGGSVFAFLNDLEIEDNGYDYGIKFIESYKETIKNYCSIYKGSNPNSEYCENITYAVYDLSKMDELNKDVDSFFADVNNNVNTDFTYMVRVRANLTQYGDRIQEYDMVDLYSLVEQYQKYSENKAEKVLEDLDKFIAYNYTNMRLSEGVSTYFPYKSNRFLAMYDGVKYSDNYAKFISNFNEIKANTRVSNFSIRDNALSLSKVNSLESDLEMELTEEQINNYSMAKYMLFVDMGDGYYRPIRSSKVINLEGNKLKANIRGKQLRITNPETNNSTWIYLVELESTEEYTKYATNVVLESENGDFKAATITIIVDDNHPNGYISSVKSIVENDEEGLGVFGVGLNLEDYEYINFTGMNYKIFDENGEFTENWQGNGVVSGLQVKVDNYKFEVEDFDSEYTYYGLFIVSDISDKSYTSNLIKLD